MDDLGTALVKMSVFVLIFIGLNKYGTEKRHPLYPWGEIDSRPYVNVINESHDTLAVWAEAPEVDRVTRLVGLVPACDSAELPIPYADTKVKIIIGNQSLIINMNKPLIWRLVVREKS